VLQAQEMDKEISNLADKLAASIKESAKKKVAVIDFTDLQGASSELGKYIAEQLTVDLVMIKKDFAVLDRANLRSILAEHKLTATGLVEPANAKKLGMFAGVDAIVLGTITPRGYNMTLTAKLITTDTAEIVGAAKADFKIDETVKELFSRSAKTEEPTGTSELRSSPPAESLKPFGDLEAKVESLKQLPGDDRYGFARITLVIANNSPTKTYGVAIKSDPYNTFNLSNSRGDEFKATDVTGIETTFDINHGFQGPMTDILPKSSITITSKSQVQWTGRPGEYRPYRLQAIVFFGPEANGRYSGLRKYNLVVDIK